jgi:ligand-binding SRPBCC domain-containing protein
VLPGQPGIMGASTSVDMSLQNVASFINWNALPGGGETGTGAGKGEIGILSGSVTTAQPSPAGRQASTTASPNLLAAAAAATNPIVLENQKPGNPQSEWDIDGAGSSNIEGFATDISVNRGTKVDFKINTNSSNYRVDIYRLGYYGGMGARKVATIQHTGVQNQPTPLRDASTGLVDAGNWSVSASWNIPADAVSGVYIAKLVRQDGVSGENHIPFIVRDDSSTSDIVFQTSDTTWQAYNGWGGANFYGGNGPATGQGAGRAYALSYNRPIATRGGVGTYAGPQDYLFGAEYSAIYWLEQNGYDVSYMSGVDVDRFGNLLLNHNLYLDVGHDEYWSGQQRANVQAARDAGVNLSFWSGNEMYWRTRWGNSISSDATAYRTLISYKETWSPGTSIDPSNQWTGTFRDPRQSPPAIGGGVPENALIGQMFQVDDVGNNLQAIKVPYDDANMRFWRNTSVANLQPGQTATLTKNYLGYEWDEAPDNGFDPAGLVRLSSTTLPVSTYLLDYGNTTGSGVSTHNLTLYRAPSGALVFGAGTVYWAWGLSDNHDLTPTPTDARVQQAMVNLFADMGIQPATLQSGLITGAPSTDSTAPTSTINAIANFTAGSAVTITGTAADLGGGVIAGVEVSTDGGLSWQNATGDETWTYTWSPQVAGTYTIKSRAVDDSINLEAPSAGRTVSVTAPSYISLFPGSATPETVNTTDASAVELGVRFQTSAAGSISGIRFYKSSQDTGTHTGSLWTSTGSLLATATFTNETATGWQIVNFSSPVSLTPGTTYVASYHTNVGHYSSSVNYFSSNVTNGPLTALASGNGVYTYSSNRAFPTSTFSATNFWVDVMFNPSTAANRAPVAANDVGPTATRDLALTIAASTLTANDSDPDSDSVSVTAVGGATNGTVVLNTQPNPQNNTITFTPTAGYTGPASFAYTISDGRGGTASATVSLTVAPLGSAPVSLFSAASTPAQTNINDGSQLQLGMKFTSSVAGQITALKFYRSPGDTGLNTVDLWTSTGTRLATATFTNTSATGWQTVALPSAVSIAANTTYVASYHTTGTYAATNSYFTTAVTNGPLTAPSTTTAGGNGVYSYGGTSTSGIFPTSTYNAANYWVDVVFAPSGGGSNQPPVASNDSGYTTTQNTALTIAAATLLANDTDPNGDPLAITGVSGATNGTVSFNAQTNAVTFTPTTGFTGAASFSYAISDGRGGTATATASLTVNPAANQPPVATNDSGYTTTQNTALTIAAAALLANDTDPNGDPLAITGVSGAANGTVSFNAQTRVVTFTPTTGYTGAASFSYAISDGRGGTATATANLTVTTPTVSLFSTSNTPAVVSNSDTAQVNLGVRFTSSAAGTINGIRYYKGANDTGTHTGSLWSSTGSLLATATFTNETTSGWQTVMFSTPVSISAGTSYVASYHSNGRYATTGNYFTTARVNGPLTASAGNNGVYTYGTANLFPTSTFNATNYWVDVLFSPASSGTNRVPVATNDSGLSVTQNSSITIAASTLLANDSDPDGDALTITGVSNGVNGTASFNAQTNAVTFTPNTGYTGPASFIYAISDGRGGAASASASLTVNAGSTSTVSLFGSNPTPSMVTVNDPQSVELGFKFQASAAGDITGLRFYKGPSNTGTHTANLWSSTGTLLATASFTNETASGWQQVNFATPVTITPGTTYVASYHTSGNYSADPGLFNSAVTSGPLTAPSSSSIGGNGVYAYGSGNLFPNNTFNSTSYGVDVLFRPQLVA